MAGLKRRWLAAGIAVASLAACDQVQSRVDRFQKLARDAAAQVLDPDGDGDIDLLRAAPLPARALAGKREEAIPIQAANLDDLLATQTFYAVGSVIAKPKVDLTDPVAAGAIDLSAADPSNAVAASPAPAAVAPTAAAPGTPASAAPGTAPVAAPGAPPGAGAGARALEVPGAKTQLAAPLAPQAMAQAQAPAPAPAPAPPPPSPAELKAAEALAPGASAGGLPKLGYRPNAIVRSMSAPDMRHQAELAPHELERAMARTGVRLNADALDDARADARLAHSADNQDAQRAGDQVMRRLHDHDRPAPRAFLVRSRLNVDRALAARTRAYSKLDELGLSGIVSPEESGHMRIVIGVKPTKFDGKIDPTKVESIAAHFAHQRTNPAEACPGKPDKAKIQNDPVLATECVIKALRATGDYEYVEEDFIFTNQMLKKPKAPPPPPGAPVTTGTGAATVISPNNPLFGLQWNLKDLGAAAGQSQGGAGFASFWNKAKTTGSKSVTIALVDTGIQMSHPDFKNSKNIAPGYNMVSDPIMANNGIGRTNDANDPGDKCDPTDPTARDSFHGTHVAGILGAQMTNNGQGVAGGDWDVTIVPVRALGRCGGKLSDINDAIRWAAGRVPARDPQGNEVWNEHPADIINLSIGLPHACPASMQAAINDAVAAGAIVVAAAGNSSIDAKNAAPGGCANVISVAAGDARGQLTPYSNWGPSVTLMAPGGDMTRDDDGDGRPDGILSTKFSTDCYDPTKPGTVVAQCYYSYENGTSMAAPHVAAALALLKAKFPTALPSELKSRLMQATTPRSPTQCSGSCTAYPGAAPIPGQTGLCYRPCGSAMLNLANAAVQ